MTATIDDRLFGYYTERIIKVGAMFTIQEYEVTEDQLVIVRQNNQYPMILLNAI